MCGIFAIFPKVQDGIPPNKSHIREAFNTIKHRGPDNSSLIITPSYVLGFHRLSINDLSDSGNQPFESGMKTRTETETGTEAETETKTICNGEIYNWKELSESHDITLKSGSDCEVLCHLFDKYGESFDYNEVDGVYACVHVRQTNDFFACRDPIGIRPLYYVETESFTAFASEAKALITFSEVKIFPIGSFWHNGHFTKYYSLPKEIKPTNRCQLYHTLVQAVEKRINNCDAEYGFFLSGGLDSSLIAGIAKTLRPDKKIKTFSIGMSKDSPDLVHARTMANALGSEHHEVLFTKEEGIATIPFIIYALESFDCTTIRASVPMHLLSKYISEKTNVKVMLSGEGADELFGGYLYFHKAPTAAAFQDETRKLVENVHMFDGLRADRCTSDWGLEVRVPFFDRAVVDNVMSMSPESKRPHKGIEKYILRKAFENTPVNAYVPHSILWRQKNAFSDAVGYGWIDAIKEYVSERRERERSELERSESERSESERSESERVFKTSPPTSDEELFYRLTFRDIFIGHEQLSALSMWRPNWTDVTDPSATYLEFHEAKRTKA